MRRPRVFSAHFSGETAACAAGNPHPGRRGAAPWVFGKGEGVRHAFVKFRIQRFWRDGRENNADRSCVMAKASQTPWAVGRTIARCC